MDPDFVDGFKTLCVLLVKGFKEGAQVGDNEFRTVGALILASIVDQEVHSVGPSLRVSIDVFWFVEHIELGSLETVLEGLSVGSYKSSAPVGGYHTSSDLKLLVCHCSPRVFS